MRITEKVGIWILEKLPRWFIKKIAILLIDVHEKTESPDSFQIAHRLKKKLSEGIKKSGLSRNIIAAKMSEMLGYEITKTMLDAYTAESKENHRVPAEWLPPFCMVTNYYEPIKLLNRLARLPLPDTDKLVEMEIARIRKEIEEREQELKKYEGIKNLLSGGRKA